MADYTSQNWEGLRGYYADTAKLHFNTTEGNPINIDEAIAENMEMATMLSDYGFIEDSEEYERVITDNDEMWVNYWATWFGVIAATGQRVEIPIHFTARFVDSLIVREHGYWNSMPFYTAMMEAEIVDSEKELIEEAEGI